MNNKNLKIKLIKVNNILGVNFYTGSIRLGDLFEHYEVPVYVPWKSPCHTDSGYQRAPKDKRVENIRDRTLLDVQDPQSFVDNINLNLRSEKAETYCKPVFIEDEDYGSFHILEYIQELGNFQLVDGQTRIKGAEKAMHKALDDGDYEKAQVIEDTQISINLTFTEDVFAEAYVFFLINEHAASIPPDGASRLLLEGYRAGKVNFINEVTNSNKNDEIFSMTIAEKLANNSKIWANKIKDFNESSGGKVSIRAMAKIIQPLYKLIDKNLKDINSSRKAEDVVFETIEAYWVGFKSLYPLLFSPKTEKDYGILKSSQAEVMMRILKYIVELSIHGEKLGGPLNDPIVHKQLLSKAFKGFTDINGAGASVKNEKLWLKGEAGSMGQYTSASAKANISARLTKRLDVALGRPTI